MNWRKITFLFTILSVVLILAYDGVAIYMDGTKASISYLIITSSYKFPIIPFLGGFLCGHFWWPIRQVKE